MKYPKVKVIALSPSYEVEIFYYPIKDNTIHYHGYDFNIKRNMIFHQDKNYVIFLNATFGLSMVHHLTNEQIYKKVMNN